MGAIIKREFAAYFAHPVGYVFLVVALGTSSLTFFTNVYLNGTTNMRSVFALLTTVLCFVVPILTMRLLSEEKRHKTEQLLYTAPVSMAQVVMGKFLGAFLLCAAGTGFTFIYQIVLDIYAEVDWGLFLSGYLGTMLMGAMLISIGMVISSLTESQAVAATAGIGVSLVLGFGLDSLAASELSPGITDVCTAVSPTTYFSAFYKGNVSLGDLFYFLAATAIFLFLTARIMDKKRYV